MVTFGVVAGSWFLAILSFFVQKAVRAKWPRVIDTLEKQRIAARHRGAGACMIFMFLRVLDSLLEGVLWLARHWTPCKVA
jgi:hypothetical protein